MLVFLKCRLFLNLLYLKCFYSNVFRLAFWHTYVYMYILGPGLGAGPHCEHRPHQVPEIDIVWASFCGPAVAPECVARVISGDGFGVSWMHGQGTAGFSSYVVLHGPSALGSGGCLDSTAVEVPVRSCYPERMIYGILRGLAVRQ